MRHLKHRSSEKRVAVKERPRRLFSLLHAYRHRWFQVFAVGLALLVLMEVSFLIAKNPNLVPAMIIYGAFLVPMTLITYLYDSLPWEVPMPLLAICLLCGGALGVAIASPLEIDLLGPLGQFRYFGVGLIEETSKLIIPVALFFVGTYRSESAGVIIGFTSAMGFSSLETAGYGFNAFMSNVGEHGAATLANILKNPLSVFELDLSFAARSLVDPVGHGTWTILTCYVLFHERRKAGRFVLNWRVGAAFVLAVLLHAAWDTSLTLTPSNVYAEVALKIAFLITLVFTIWLFVRIVRKARRAEATTEPGAAWSRGT
jgi:RsiW-degrading membrane proteinase PrsW (M82 family)